MKKNPGRKERRRLEHTQLSTVGIGTLPRGSKIHGDLNRASQHKMRTRMGMEKAE